MAGSSDQTAAERIEKHGTVLDAYHREGGVWLPHAPVLVNEDFDFAIAMSLEGGLGAGLAAAKRKENNQKTVVAMGDLRLAPDVEARIEALRCSGTHVYFLIWGAEQAVLRMVVDVEGDAGKSRVVEGGSAEELDAAARKLLAEVVDK